MCSDQFAGQDPKKYKKSSKCCYIYFSDPKKGGKGGMACPNIGDSDDIQTICANACKAYKYDTGYAHPHSCNADTCGCTGTSDDAQCDAATGGDPTNTDRGHMGKDGLGVCVCGNN